MWGTESLAVLACAEGPGSIATEEARVRQECGEAEPPIS